MTDPTSNTCSLLPNLSFQRKETGQADNVGNYVPGRHEAVVFVLASVRTFDPQHLCREAHLVETVLTEKMIELGFYPGEEPHACIISESATSPRVGGRKTGGRKTPSLSLRLNSLCLCGTALPRSRADRVVLLGDLMDFISFKVECLGNESGNVAGPLVI